MVLPAGRGALHRALELLVTGDAALSLDQAHRDHALVTGLRISLGLFAFDAYAESLLAIVEDGRAHVGLTGFAIRTDIRRRFELFLTLRHYQITTFRYCSGSPLATSFSGLAKPERPRGSSSLPCPSRRRPRGR